MALTPVYKDKKVKLAAPFAHAIIAPTETEDNLKLLAAKVNYTGYNLKRKGSVVIAVGTDAHTLVMAMGDYTESTWVRLHTSGVLTPTGDAVAKGTQYNDRKPKILETSKIGSLDFPIVSKKDLEDGNSGVNNTLHSGKKFGAAVIMEFGSQYRLCIAGGPNADSSWFELDGSEHRVSAPTASNKVKPKVINGTAAAVPFPYVDATGLAKSANIINVGDGTVSGKKLGSLVVAKVSSKPVLYLATGPAATDPWVKLLGADATGKVTPA